MFDALRTEFSFKSIDSYVFVFGLLNNVKSGILSVSYWEAREDDSNNARLPPFIVAVLSTEQQTTHLIQQIESRIQQRQIQKKSY
eukprot:scaffold5864_cov74-Cyclotella_meneghiniana.AAC.2